MACRVEATEEVDEFGAGSDSEIGQIICERPNKAWSTVGWKLVNENLIKIEGDEILHGSIRRNDALSAIVGLADEVAEP